MLPRAQGTTPLLSAVIFSRPPVIELLLEKGVDMTASMRVHAQSPPRTRAQAAALATSRSASTANKQMCPKATHANLIDGLPPSLLSARSLPHTHHRS
jgi:hypothetical protein